MDNYGNYAQHLGPVLYKKDFNRVACGYLISVETAVYLQDIY